MILQEILDATTNNHSAVQQASIRVNRMLDELRGAEPVSPSDDSPSPPDGRLHCIASEIHNMNVSLEYLSARLFVLEETLFGDNATKSYAAIGGSSKPPA